MNECMRAAQSIESEGYTICETINFSVSQAVAVGERFRKGIERAKKAGIKPGQCFAVQQVGRLDDYIRGSRMLPDIMQKRIWILSIFSWQRRNTWDYDGN